MRRVVENHKEEAEDIKDLIENILWEYISIDNLLDVVDHFPMLRKNKAFQKLFKNEMQRRFDSREPFNPPRKCYKYQVHTNSSQPFLSVLTEAFFDPKKELSELINQAVEI